MKLHSIALRRTAVAGVFACAAALGPAVALASAGGPGVAPSAGGPGVAPSAGGPAVASGCATSGLDVWLNTQGSGAAGHMYYSLEFTNLSGSTCTLYGFPGVSGVGLAGGQLGSAASRDGSTPATVTLASGATASATVGITDAGLYPASTCHPVTAAGLRVYPPNQTQAKVVPFPFPACAKAGDVYLVTSPVRS